MSGCLPGGSPVRISPSPGRGQDSPESDRVFGGSIGALFAIFDPPSRSWKTSEPSLFEDLIPSLDRLPKSGTMLNGRIFERRTSEPRTAGRESGLWPTPAASVTNLLESPESWMERAERLKAKGYNSNGAGMPLTIAAKVWPTPKSSPSGPDYARMSRPGSGGDDLATAVARCGGGATLYPTPNARDWKDSGPTQGNRHSPNLGTVVGGQLNPTWVEALMGYPRGWTDILE